MTGRRLGRPPEVDRPDRIADITAAAIGLFSERGFAAVTFVSVAQSAGMTAAALYRYFDDKASLYLHAVRAAREQTWAAIAEGVPVGVDPIDDFQRLTRFVVGLRGPLSTSVRLLASAQVTAGQHPELAMLLDERWRVRHEMVGGIGRRAFESGRAGDFDSADEAAGAVELIFSGFAMEAYSQPRRAKQIAAVAVQVLRGLFDPSPTGPRSGEEL